MYLLCKISLEMTGAVALLMLLSGSLSVTTSEVTHKKKCPVPSEEEGALTI